MVEPLSVNTDGVRTLGGIHTGVAAGLGALAGDAPGSGEVAMSHGAIASGVNSALANTLGARSGSMASTRSSAERLAELLRQAALAYERGDQRGGEAIKAAADAIAGGGTPAAAGAATSAGSTGATDAIGQVVSQLGQVGQLPQQLGTPLAALAEPLQQLPQQMMQGVQQTQQVDVPPGPGPEGAPQPDSRGLQKDAPAGPESGEHATATQDTNDADAATDTQPGSGAAPRVDPVIGPANRSSTDAASPPQR
ncbi:MAG: ESX-1 secretion-associated protein [Actinomycetia bacterium]|nr:ESX-1 secretion-associated protein [Actinomycetes bacterium]